MGGLRRAAALLAGAALGSAVAAAAESGVETLVLVTIDTLRADHVGAYGGPVPTPALDGLAAEGVLLEDAFTPTPTTGPAHASLFTGLHPWRHGVLDNAVPLAGEASTLAEHLRRAGFATRAFVSTYVLHERFGLDRGFERYDFVSTEDAVWRGEVRRGFYARGDATTRRALDAVRAHVAAGGGPLFLWVHYFDPHAPWEAPEPFVVDARDPVDLDGKTVPAFLDGPPDLARAIRAYRGEVRYADAQVGALLAGLRAAGVLEGAAVVVTSDHGEGLGDHGHMHHGANLYDELVRVPLIARAPGLPSGRRLRGPAQLEDLLPTLLALAGVAVPSGRDGVDLLPWLRGDAARSPRAQAFGRRKEYPDAEPLFFAWGRGRKWIGELAGPGLRFDAARDPRELHGLRVQRSPARLRESLKGARPASERRLDPESRRALEALGYLDPPPDGTD